jgi:hypothetical protein
MGRCYGEWVVG